MGHKIIAAFVFSDECPQFYVLDCNLLDPGPDLNDLIKLAGCQCFSIFKYCLLLPVVEPVIDAL